MPKAKCRRAGFWAALGIVALAGAGPSANAADSPASVKSADQYIANGNLKAAEIELRNAVREAPQDPLLRTRLARVYLQLGDPVSAEREARAARERNGNEADYLPVLDDALLRQGKFADLSDLVRPGNRPAPLESKVRWALGVAAFGLHDHAKSEALLRDAIRLDPSAVPPKVSLARLMATTNPAEANKLLDAALAADPRSVEALQVKGELERAQGNAPAAMARFDEALRIDPKNVGARLSRASLNIAAGKFAEADQDLDPVLKANPNSIMANYLRAVELDKRQQYAAADRILDRLSPAFAQFPSGYYIEGATKLALGQNVLAESILQKYLAQFPNDAKAARLAAAAALRQHAPQRAVDYLKPIADKPGADAQSLALLGNAYLATGKAELALQFFDKAAALEPNNPAIQTRMAISEISAGQGKEGLAALQRVFDTEAGATIAGPTLALTQLRAGQFDKAAQTVGTLIKRDAKNPLYQTLLGMVKTAQHDIPAAETAFQTALAQDPQFAAARQDLAQLYLAGNRPDDAIKLYKEALAKKPDDAAALLGLANVAMVQKNWSAANDYVNRARSAAPNDTAPGLAQVRLFELQQDWANAKAVASALSAQFPSDVAVLEAQAQAQLGAGDTNGAISSYKRAHELAPDSMPILSSYLNLLGSAKYYREANGVLRRAVDRNPKNAALKANLVRVTAELDGVDAAVSLANSYAKSDPASNAYTLVADQLYENAGRWGDARALLEKETAAHPTDGALAVALARLDIRTGQFAKATAVLTNQLKTDPNNAAVASVLGSLDLATNRTPDARKVFSERLAHNANDVTGLLGLADVAIAERKWGEAAADIERARAAAPNDPTPGVRLVNLYISQQDWKKAASTAAGLAAKFPTNPDILELQARAELGVGETKDAIATYQRAYDLAPNSTQALSSYLSALNGAKDYVTAQSVLQAALGRAPQNNSIKADLIRVAAQIGGTDAGLAKAREMSKRDPNNPIYDIISAELLNKAGRGKEATELLERSLAANSTDDVVLTTLARLYATAGNRGKAESVLNTRLGVDPGDGAARSALAGLLLESKDYNGAIAQYSKIIEAHPDDPAALNNLAWLYQQKGDLAKARSLAERAVAAAPSAAQIDDTLGWILLAQGDTTKAVTYLSAANVSAPADPAIQYHLAVALQRAGRGADAQTMLEKLLGSGAPFADKADAEKLLAQLKHS